MELNVDFFKNNRKRLAKLIDPESLVVFFSAEVLPRSGDQSFKYRQNSDTFYFSGLTQPETCILIQTDNSKNIFYEHAFIIEPKEEIIIWTGHKYSKDEVIEISGIERVSYINEFEITLEERIKKSKNVYFSFKSNVRGINYFHSQNSNYTEKIKSGLYGLKNILNIDPFSMELRLIKQQVELFQIKKAIEITANCFSEIRQIVKPGIFEYEIEAIIYKNVISAGANDVAYLPIVASGKNNCVLHYTTNRNKCLAGELLLLDFGSEYNYYAADLTRTIPVCGYFTKRQEDVYMAVRNVQKEMITKMKPGTTINKLNAECEILIEQELLSLGLLSKEDIANQRPDNPVLKRYFMHGVSHFLGLDVHDVGKKDIELKPGMVLTCEPAIYIAEEGFGIRLENDILITNANPDDLCSYIPIDLEDLLS